MELPHSTVQIEIPQVPKFKSACFCSSTYARMNIIRLHNSTVELRDNGTWGWSARSLDEFAEFCTALAKQLRLENDG